MILKRGIKLGCRIIFLVSYLSDSNILHILGTVFAMFARFGIGGSTSCLFLYIPELFPTKIR